MCPALHLCTGWLVLAHPRLCADCADAHKLALHGPEPAKRWLQQHLVGPWKRTGATGSSSGGGPCMAAGYCSRSLLLHGPSGSGKTEVVHALASEMGANLLYLPGGESLLKTYQQEGHRLLRALFAVSQVQSERVGAAWLAVGRLYAALEVGRRHVMQRTGMFTTVAGPRHSHTCCCRSAASLGVCASVRSLCCTGGAACGAMCRVL